ncbi:ABC transporter permease [Bacillus sp. ISL-45]|uniref:ABC transporter permease n=1 Tax=Bacillus sp. ISL-45 TaxID=2819128 RepID=UPI001BECEA17|nr:ABC transporter permease [Bacillus sp. ISL-45]MBT2659802.1 ABC transporter permease [Bacillus sp. ISL-45]
MNTLWNRGWRPFMVLLLFFLFWEMITRVQEIPAWLLPAPSVIFKEAAGSYPLFLPDIGATLTLAITGLLLGSTIGFLIAMILHLIPSMRNAFYPLLILSQNVPIIVLAPLLVIWFGFGFLPKLLIIILVCFFPVTIASLDGFSNVPGELLHYMRMSGATRFQTFSKLELPNALSPLFSGLKIAATYSVMGAVISEWLGAEKGIGVFMTLSSSAFRTDRVFIAIFIIIFFSMLLYSVIVMIEKNVIKWNVKSEE